VNPNGEELAPEIKDFFSHEGNKHKNIPLRVVGAKSAYFGVSVDIYTCRYTLSYIGDDS
jgi:hypothetical protein